MHSDAATSSSILTTPLVAASQPAPAAQKQALIRAEALINTHADGAFPRPEAFSRSCSGTWCSQSDYESHHLHVVMGTAAERGVRRSFYQIYTV